MKVRAGLHFSCCGHVSERLVKILSERPIEGGITLDGGLPPISKIDAFGLNNLSLETCRNSKFLLQALACLSMSIALMS